MSPANSTTWREWVAIFMLGIASFTVVTSELAPIGMLSAIAQALHQKTSTAGVVVTLYAWVGAAAALVSVTMISHLPRRPLLVGLMLVLGLSNGVAAMSHQFNLLLMARLIGALAHGAFWAIIGSLGAKLVSDSHVGKATAIVFGGVSIASVLGVPLINWISAHADWRWSFSLLASLSIITAIMLAICLPAVTGTAPIERRQLLSVVKNPSLRIVYLIAGCSIVAHFAAFTFIETLLSSVLALPETWVTLYLLIFGVAGVIGNIICGVFIDSHLKKMLGIGLLLVGCCLLLINSPMFNSRVSILLLLAGWGIGVAILFVGFQTWILRIAKEDALPASAIYAAIFNGAVGFGAILGTGVLAHWSLSILYYLTSIIMLISLILLCIARKRLTL